MAGKAIRGITVEIGGNTTGLDKALATSEKKSRSLQTELREVSKLLKFDPTNTELLAQKQDILKSAISETSDKLKTLKEAQAQVLAQFERGEIGENQYRAFQREIMQTENSLEDMRKELNTTEDALKKVSKSKRDAKDATSDYGEAVEQAKKELEDFKDKANETFETLKDGAKTMGTALGGAMVATGGYALKLSTDFDKAFNTLATKTGASAEEMEGLNESMERVYANNFGDSIEDVANSMATVKTQTGLAGEELQKATENALLMRDTFDMDVNESIRAVNSLMDQFGITSDEAYNLIAQGAQKGLNQNDDLLDTINEYSIQFKDAGYNAEDMFNMLANGVDAGTWSVDKLGDAVKEFNIRASDGTVRDAIIENAKAFGMTKNEAKALASRVAGGNVDAYKKLGDELRNVASDTERYQLGVEMFGTMWEDLGEETVLALLDTQGEISKTSSALEDINNTKYDDIGSALEGLGRSLETDVVKPLGEELKPLVEEAIDYVKENGPQIKDVLSEIVQAVGEFVGWIVDNSDVVISTITAIGTGLLVWNVASMINSVVGAIKAYKLANEGATIAQALFNAVLNANPIMLLVTVIAAVVAGIVTFIMTNDEAREKFIEIWNKIKETAGEVLSAIGQFFVDTWESIKKAWSACVEYFSQLWEDIKKTYSSVKSTLSGYFSSAWTSIQSTWKKAGAFFRSIWNEIKKIYSSVKSTISGYFSNAWSAVKNTWNSAKSYFSDIWSGVKNTFSNVGSWFRDTFSKAWTAVKNVFSSWGSFFDGLWTKIKNKFSSIGTNIATAISSSVKSGMNRVISAVERIINNGIGLINSAIKLANKLPGVNVSTIKKLSLPRLAKGAIIDSPTIAEIGENGREAVLPLENNTGWLQDIARRLNEYMVRQPILNDGAVLASLDRIYERLDRLQVVLDSGELVGGIVDPMDVALNDRYNKVARGW
jgi:phage-related minor tail protein